MMASSFASCEILSRAGRGVDRAAAYGERRALVAEDDRVMYRPRHRDDHVGAFTLLPRLHPARFEDPRTLWEVVERHSLGRGRVTGLGFVLTLPREDELALPECLALTRRFAELLHGQQLPVRVDLHRVLARDGSVHRHAHVVMGLRPVTGSGLGHAVDRSWLPVIRKGVVQGIDWPAVWREVQRVFFQERGIPLAVAPATGWAEPKVVGRPTRATSRRLAGRRPEDVRSEVAEARTLYVRTPSDILPRLSTTASLFSEAEIEAYIATGLADPQARAEVLAEVLAHPDLIDLLAGEEDAPRRMSFKTEMRFTTRAALERARTFAGSSEQLDPVGCIAATSTVALAAELESSLKADGPRQPVVIWADSWLRRRVEDGVEWPAGTRHVASRHVADLDERIAAVLRWSRGRCVIVVGADRLDDRELSTVLARAAAANVALELRIVTDHPLPRRSHTLAVLLIEKILGKTLPPDPDARVAEMILRNRLDQADYEHGADDVVARIGADIRPEEDQATCLSPRMAWRSPPNRAVVVVQSAEDWHWAAPLLRRHPDWRATFNREVRELGATAILASGRSRALARLASEAGLTRDPERLQNPSSEALFVAEERKVDAVLERVNDAIGVDPIGPDDNFEPDEAFVRNSDDWTDDAEVEPDEPEPFDEPESGDDPEHDDDPGWY